MNDTASNEAAAGLGGRKDLTAFKTITSLIGTKFSCADLGCDDERQ